MLLSYTLQFSVDSLGGRAGRALCFFVKLISNLVFSLFFFWRLHLREAQKKEKKSHWFLFRIAFGNECLQIIFFNKKIIIIVTTKIFIVSATVENKMPWILSDISHISQSFIFIFIFIYLFMNFNMWNYIHLLLGLHIMDRECSSLIATMLVKDVTFVNKV